MIYLELEKDNKAKRFKFRHIDLAIQCIKKCKHIKHLILSDKPITKLANYEELLLEDLNSLTYIEMGLNNWQ